MTVYLDCNATTPIEPEVADELMRFTIEEFGNAGSRTHSFGTRAKKRVNLAREQIASVVDTNPSDLVFTSGATESNNLAILGLAHHGVETRRKHIVSTALEHKAVLEPVEQLKHRGFEVDMVGSDESGVVDPDEVADLVRRDTLIVSVQQVNNETGAIQPLSAIASRLDGKDAFFHVDAAQGFGKELDGLRDPRIDLISISGHKVYAPKGVGALAIRRRGQVKPPLAPLMFGGGQEKGLRPGTHPVALIAALGTAAELATNNYAGRMATLQSHMSQAVENIELMGARFNSDPKRTIPTTANFSIPGLDSEAAIVLLKSTVAVSNGSACNSQSYEPSHVLVAMGLPEDRIAGAIRMSWSHMTPEIPWEKINSKIGMFATGPA